MRKYQNLTKSSSQKEIGNKQTDLGSAKSPELRKMNILSPKFNRKQNFNQIEKKKKIDHSESNPDLVFISPKRSNLNFKDSILYETQSIINKSHCKTLNIFRKDSDISNIDANSQYSKNDWNENILHMINDRKQWQPQSQRRDKFEEILEVQKLEKIVKDTKQQNMRLKRNLEDMEFLKEFINERQQVITRLTEENISNKQKILQQQEAINQCKDIIQTQTTVSNRLGLELKQEKQRMGCCLQKSKAEVISFLRQNQKLKEELKIVKSQKRKDGQLYKRNRESAILNDKSAEKIPKKLQKNQSVLIQKQNSIFELQFASNAEENIITNEYIQEIKKLKDQLKYQKIQIDILRRIKNDCQKIKQDNQKFKKSNRRLLRRIEVLTHQNSERGDLLLDMDLEYSPEKGTIQ